MLGPGGENRSPWKQPTPPDIRDEPATTSSAQVTMQANHDDGADDMQTSDFLPDAVKELLSLKEAKRLRVILGFSMTRIQQSNHNGSQPCAIASIFPL